MGLGYNKTIAHIYKNVCVAQPVYVSTDIYIHIQVHDYIYIYLFIYIIYLFLHLSKLNLDTFKIIEYSKSKK